MLTKAYLKLAPAPSQSFALPTPLAAMTSTALIISGHVYKSEGSQPAPVSYMKTPAALEALRACRTSWSPAAVPLTPVEGTGAGVGALVVVLVVVAGVGVGVGAGTGALVVVFAVVVIAGSGAGVEGAGACVEGAGTGWVPGLH